MLYHRTITKYLSKIFIQQFIAISAVILCILLVSSIFDTLQKFKSFNLSGSLFWQLVVFKIPHLYIEVLVLTCFISGLFFIKNLSQNNEMIIIVSSGLALWRVFIIPALVILLLGYSILLVLNPISVYGLKEYRKLEAKIEKNIDTNLLVSQSGILFFEKFFDTNRIIQVKSMDTKKNILNDLVIILVDSKNNFVKRIDCKKAILQDGKFQLINPIIINNYSTKKMPEESINLPTNLSMSNLVQRFTSPEMINIIEYKEVIEKLKKSGVPIKKYLIYYYKQLFKPLAMIAIASIAFWFFKLNTRNNKVSKFILLGTIFGICAYFLLELFIKILASSNIDPLLATLLPIIFIITMSNFVILHFQEA